MDNIEDRFKTTAEDRGRRYAEKTKVLTESRSKNDCRKVAQANNGGPSRVKSKKSVRNVNKSFTSTASITIIPQAESARSVLLVGEAVDAATNTRSFPRRDVDEELDDERLHGESNCQQVQPFFPW